MAAFALLHGRVIAFRQASGIARVLALPRCVHGRVYGLPRSEAAERLSFVKLFRDGRAASLSLFRGLLPASGSHRGGLLAPASAFHRVGRLLSFSKFPRIAQKSNLLVMVDRLSVCAAAAQG